MQRGGAARRGRRDVCQAPRAERRVAAQARSDCPAACPAGCGGGGGGGQGSCSRRGGGAARGGGCAEAAGGGRVCPQGVSACCLAKDVSHITSAPVACLLASPAACKPRCLPAVPALLPASPVACLLASPAASLQPVCPMALLCCRCWQRRPQTLPPSPSTPPPP